MSSVNVDTKLSETDYYVFGGLFAGLLAFLYFSKVPIDNLPVLVSVLALTVLALVMYYMLTDHRKLTSFIESHQLLALIGASVVSAVTLGALFGIGSVRMVMGRS